MSCDLCCEQVQELCGGITSSVFKLSESMLINSSRLQETLKFIAHRKDMERYNSIMDFIFCEIWTEYQIACFKFYDKKGPPLRETMPKTEIEYYDGLIIKAFQVALELLKKYEKKQWSKKSLSWVSFRTIVLKAAS